MCNPLKKLIVFFAFILLIQPTICFAEKSEEDYHELFIHASQTDGAYSEGVRDDLARAFENNAEAFVSALAVEDDAVQKRIVILLVYTPGHTYDGLLANVDTLSSQLNWNEAEQHIL